MTKNIVNKSLKHLKIIVFEGLDKSGKNTQSELTKEHLLAQGYKVYKLEYPDYTSKWGKLIRAMLTGEIEFEDEKFEEYQTTDKLKDVELIYQLDKEGYDYLIIDRYVTTQEVYAKTKGKPELQKWIDKVKEGLPQPTLEFFLDVQVETSVGRRGQHGDNDKYESNLDYLRGVRNTYLELMLEKPNSVVLTNIDNKSKGLIFETILQTLEGKGVI